MKSPRIGEILVERQLIRPADLTNALSVQEDVGGPLGLILVRLGALSENDLLAVLSEQLGLAVQTRETMPPPDLIDAFISETATASGWWSERQAVAWRHTPPVDEDEPELVPAPRVICAAVQPLDPMLRNLLEQVSEIDVEWRLAPRSLIGAALEDLRAGGAGLTTPGSTDAARLREAAEQAPVIDFVNAVFAEALHKRASDVHIEPFEDQFVVRMRVDGILHTARTSARANFDAVCSRIKLLSGMDIGERRLPQDGRQAVRISGQEIDLRVSTLPATWGESIVMRLLGKTSRLPELKELGFSDRDAATLTGLVDQPNGIVLITGPTGSGKTTTIYRLLSALNDGERKIVTVEDPVELDLPGVVQVHVRSDIGLTFAAGLRSILRQDPEVIMVGEIRDPETARIAVQAALTGHMVISTVHTNSALAAISRLRDLGIEDYLLADVLRGVAGQRLARRICDVCSVSPDRQHAETYAHALTAKLRSKLPGGEPVWRDSVGCRKCNGTGFVGRLGLYEIAPIGADISAAIRHRASERELITLARSQGFTTMFEDGLLKAATGRTSMAEVYRVIGASDPEDAPVSEPVLGVAVNA